MYISSIFIFIFLVGYAVLIGVIISLLLGKQEIEHLSKNKDKKIEELTKQGDAAKENIKDLNNHIAMVKGKIANYHTELIIASSGIMNLHNRLATANSEITNLKAELTTTIEQRAEISQSNANALWQLHLSDVSLQAGAAAFYEECAKSELLESISTVLQQKHDALNKTHQNFVDKSKKKANRRFVLGVFKVAVDALPYGGTVVDFAGEVVDKVKDFFSGAGDAVPDMSDTLGDTKSLGEALENLENQGSASILMSQDTDEIPTALTKDVQGAYKGAFNEYLMEPEELDPSAFSKFSTATIVKTGNVVTIESVSGNENDETILKIFSKFKDLGIEYYDYHKTYKSPTEGAAGSGSEG